VKGKVKKDMRRKEAIKKGKAARRKEEKEKSEFDLSYQMNQLSTLTARS
jgi:hypothetical protein